MVRKDLPKMNLPQRRLQPQVLFKKKGYNRVLGVAIIALLGTIIYLNSFRCPFVFDDLTSIVNNLNIRNLYDVSSWWNFSPNRPVSVFSFVLNYHFNKLNVEYWHLVNLIIHLINAYLVWWLSLMIFSSPVLKNHPLVRDKNILSFLTALLFVSHPLMTQAVTYIVQRQTSLAAMFYLLSIALYTHARLSDKSQKLKIMIFLGAFIAAILALFSKENTYTLPFSIILLEIFFLKQKKIAFKVIDYHVILILAGFLGLIMIVLLRFSFSIFNPIPPFQGNAFTLTPYNYFLTQFSVLVKYIQLLILPINQNLDYDFPVSDHFFSVQTFLSFMLIVSLIIIAFYLFKRNRLVSFGIFWFFLTLSVESGIFPLTDVIFEHRTYLPSFGFLLILSYCIYGLFWNKYKYIALSLFVVIIITNSYLTFSRNKVWTDELTLWTDVVSKSPNKARPYNNRGFVYMKQKQWNKAIADFSKAIAINSTWAVPCYNRGVANDILGERDKAINDYSSAVRNDTNYMDAYYKRSLVYGNYGKMEDAIADLSKVIEIAPTFTEAIYNRGVSYEFTGQWEKAITDFSRVIEMDKKTAKAYSNRGAAYTKLGQWDKAIEDYSRAIEAEPGLAATYNNRGSAYLNTGQTSKAIEDFIKATGIDTNFTDARNNLNFAIRNLKTNKQ